MITNWNCGCRLYDIGGLDRPHFVLVTCLQYGASYCHREARWRHPKLPPPEVLFTNEPGRYRVTDADPQLKRIEADLARHYLALSTQVDSVAKKLQSEISWALLLLSIGILSCTLTVLLM
jgi:hypothetical protein